MLNRGLGWRSSTSFTNDTVFFKMKCTFQQCLQYAELCENNVLFLPSVSQFTAGIYLHPLGGYTPPVI